MNDNGRNIPPSKARLSQAAKQGLFPRSKLLCAGVSFAIFALTLWFFANGFSFDKSPSLAGLVVDGLQNGVLVKQNPQDLAKEILVVHGHIRILAKHVMPGAVGPVLVSATFGIAGAILIESTLSFLGYGAPPPTASWGQLLADAFANEHSFWLTVFPGIALFLTVLSINVVGEGMRESLEA